METQKLVAELDGISQGLRELIMADGNNLPEELFIKLEDLRGDIIQLSMKIQIGE